MRAAFEANIRPSGPAGHSLCTGPVRRAARGRRQGGGRSRLLERLGISWAETAAFGDGENDAGNLLEAAGFAVAMEGGAQSLLPLADAVAPAAALDGAAAAVREYLLERRARAGKRKNRWRTPAAGRCARPAQSWPGPQRRKKKWPFPPVYGPDSPHTDRGNLAQPQKPGAGLFLRPSAESRSGRCWRGFWERPCPKACRRKRHSSSPMAWRCGTPLKAVPSPALRMLPSETWCPRTLRALPAKRPSGAFCATGPRRTGCMKNTAACPGWRP